MSATDSRRTGRRPARALLWAALLGMAVPAAACELDGLSHGYGPMSALFAGAHRYQSLNGLEDEESPPEPPPETPPPEPADEATASADAPSPPPAPPRSFVAWAKAKPKPADASSTNEGSPPAWARTPAPALGSAQTPSPAPEPAER